MARMHADHDEIVRFAQDRVNLPRDTANEYHAQAERLREKLGRYLKDHPDFTGAFRRSRSPMPVPSQSPVGAKRAGVRLCREHQARA